MSNQKAFPITNPIDYNNGMDLRDYFAAKAMQAMLTSQAWNHKPMQAMLSDDDPVAIEYELMYYAEGAYRMADAMMEARKDEP